MSTRKPLPDAFSLSLTYLFSSLVPLIPRSRFPPRLLKASILSFESVRERALTRGSFRVVRLASSEKFVSLFSLFLRPRRVFWVECYFDEVAFRGFLWIPRILTER